MGPKKSEADRSSHGQTEFELGDAAAGHTEEEGGEGAERTRGREAAQKQRKERQKAEAHMEEIIHSAEEGVAEKCARTEVTQKWTHRVEDRRAHCYHNQGTRRGT